MMYNNEDGKRKFRQSMWVIYYLDINEYYNKTVLKKKITDNKYKYKIGTTSKSFFSKKYKNDQENYYS